MVFNSIRRVDVTIAAGATSGTAKVPANGELTGYSIKSGDQIIKSIVLDSGTATVTLNAAATANNVITLVFML